MRRVQGSGWIRREVGEGRKGGIVKRRSTRNEERAVMIHESKAQKIKNGKELNHNKLTLISLSFLSLRASEIKKE